MYIKNRLLASRRRYFLLVISFLILGHIINHGVWRTQAAAQSYYVAPNGNDNNPGTLAKPWRTIDHAVSNSVIKPGDTVYIRGGVYQEYVQQKISGAPGNWVTYRNYPGEEPVLTGSGNWRWHILDQSYVRIEGITFRDYQKGALQVRTRDADISHIEIINNKFENQSRLNGDGNKAIHITTLDTGLQISEVVFRGNTLFNIDSGNHPVLQVAGNVSKVLVENNVVSETSSIAINVVGRSSIGQPESVVIRGNDVSNHGLMKPHSPGIYLDAAGQNVVIEENYVHHGSQGINVSLESVASDLITQQVIVRRNVIYNNREQNLKLGVGSVSNDCSQEGVLKNSVAVHNTIVVDEGDATNNRFSCGNDLHWKNNLLVHTSPVEGFHYKLDNDTVDPSSWVVNYNHFYSTVGDKFYRWRGNRYTFLWQFQSATGQDLHSGTGDPGFVDGTAGNYHIEADSPLRDNGGSLTRTNGAGSGMTIPVAEIWYFSDGLGLQEGDRIRVGGEEAVVVVEVDYASRTLTVDRAISWQDAAAVSYDYTGLGPDIGAFEFVPQLSLVGTPANGEIVLRWELNDDLAETAVWQITYQGPQGDQPSPITSIPFDQRSYRLTGLANYTSYIVTLTAVADGESLLSDTVTVMPTDHFNYLPLIR